MSIGAPETVGAPDAIRYEVVHRTAYVYDDDVVAGYNVAHLVPRATAQQSCLRSIVTIDPAPDDLRERADAYGNRMTWFSVQAPHRELVVTATSDVEVRAPGHGALAGHDAGTVAWEDAVAALVDDPDADALDAREFVLESPMVGRHAGLDDLARAAFTPGRSLVEAAADLMGRIHREIAYVPGSTSIATPLATVLEDKRGVCQDLAHLMVGCLRAVGLPARYVSGYLETDPAPGQAKLMGADASHAWASLFVPGAGWVPFDPTNDQIPDQRYIVTAWGRDYGDVAPIKGVVFSEAAAHDLTVSVDVIRR
ncbi:MAG: transglutaminase family protein [Acidimicrobiales bacterium]